MKNLIILAILSSCAHTQVSKPVVVAPTREVSVPEGSTGEGSSYEHQPTQPLEPSSTFSVNVTTEKCSEAHKLKVKEAATFIGAMYNSKQYKEEVLGFKYVGKVQFNYNSKMDNRQIYDHLMSGAEALSPSIDKEMDLSIVCYSTKNSTVGYTYKSDPKIYSNMHIQEGYSVCNVASNMVHEWAHKMGFGHASSYSAARNFTVPYGHNTIVKKLCPLFYAGKLENL